MSSAAAPFSFPMEANYDNRSSTFFRTNPGAQLPTPAHVRLLALETHPSRAHQFRRPPVLHLPTQGMVVKYGLDVSISEAHCMLFVRDYFERTAAAEDADGAVPAPAPAYVPVPEIYGWRTDQHQTFLYMQHMPGTPLHGWWHSLTEAQRLAFAGHVRAMVAALRRIPQALVAAQPFVGHVNGGPLLDWTIVHSATPHAGPFASTAAFHDWLAFSYGGGGGGGSDVSAAVRACRARLPDDAPVVLTHGNLHMDNILVARAPGPGPATAAVDGLHITAVLDWTQAGWYPAYWEACKAYWSIGPTSGNTWSLRYLRLHADPGHATPEMQAQWLEMVLRRAM